MAYKEVYAVDSFFLVLMALGIFSFYQNHVRTSEPELSPRTAVQLVWWLIPGIALCVLLGVRLFTGTWFLAKLIAGDRQAFDSAWAQLCESDRQLGILQSLKHKTNEISSALDGCEPRQCLPCYEASLGLSGRESGNSLKGTTSHGSFSEFMSVHQSSRNNAINSLDQLMEQAKCLNVFLKEKVKLMASEANGYFRAHSSENHGQVSLTKYNSISASMVDWIWANVKPADRALEKLLRSYDCDVSQLLDCCRQTVYFDSLRDLFAGLIIVMADSEVEIVGLKNRLDDNFDSWKSGGFRFDFNISLPPLSF
jgi:hypothetical protein